MDRSGIEKAARLLAKAESTDSDPEAVALALRAYALLADAINRYELTSAGEGRRRERRRLWDRRGSTRAEYEAARQRLGLRGPLPTSPPEGYARIADDGDQGRGRRIDYPL